MDPTQTTHKLPEITIGDHKDAPETVGMAMTRDGEKAALESNYVNLTQWQATRIFWKPTFICACAMAAVLMDGYATQTPGEPTQTLLPHGR